MQRRQTTKRLRALWDQYTFDKTVRVGGGGEWKTILRETTSRGRCGLVCPSRTSERGGERDCVCVRECVLFIGTQFSNLYSAVDTSARGRVVVCLVFVCLVIVCKYVLGHFRVSQPLSEPPVMPPPAPWLFHFALCLPDLPQTPP